ncbi:MAG: YcgL domain-containing protein [Agarilytica sp.]
MKKLVDIYRCMNKEGAYIYVEKGFDLKELPAALCEQAGKLEFSMTLVMTPDKKLAQTTAKKVLAALEEQNFYLQMPPISEDYMQQIPNDKLPQKPI